MDLKRQVKFFKYYRNIDKDVKKFYKKMIFFMIKAMDRVTG